MQNPLEIKNDIVFDENPIPTEEEERILVKTLNGRETMCEFLMEEYEDNKLKTRNRDQRIQSLTRSSISSDKNEECKSRSF